MSVYKGRCAECNASYNSKAFKSRREGCDVPSLDERVLEFQHESTVNNKICRGCQFRNRDLLKSKRAREEEREANKDVGSKQLKPDSAPEQDESGDGREREEYAVASRDIVRDANDAIVADVGALDAGSSEEEEEVVVEGDVVLMLLSLAASNV